MELAEKYQIPLSRESVQVRREGGRTLIDAIVRGVDRMVADVQAAVAIRHRRIALMASKPTTPADVGR